jgi:hypothetical protein
MKTSELTGAALDWAVAKCEGHSLEQYDKNGPWYVGREIVGFSLSPSTDWSRGGPIIEREFITIDQKEKSICACIDAPDGHECNDIWANGPTPLIAAMRCYVASRLGDEVELPEELEVTA